MKGTLLLIVLVSTVFAGAVRVQVLIKPEDVSFQAEDSWTVVNLNLNADGIGVLATTEPGKPLLPVLSGNVLIPADARVKGVKLEDVVWQELGSGFRVYPVQPMRPISNFNAVGFVGPDRAVYSSAAAFPDQVISAMPAGSKSGFKIAGFLFCPFQYFPESGRLLMATRAEILVEYEEQSAPLLTLSSEQWALFQEDVRRLVVNQQDLTRFSPRVAELDQNELDVVVVTSSQLQPAVESFASYLRLKGYFTEVVPTETIYARYPGRDNPEKIRNMLKELFARRGLKYVVLAGDVQHVPCRTGYLPYSPYNVPADLYYSDLDGSWDGNNNNQFGEYYYTNYNPDSVDLYSDIIVGRLPFDSAGNCANFLYKDTIYERHPDTTYLHRVLLPFEYLWTNIDYYGRIVNKNIARALSAMATWLVDSVYSMTPSQCIASINSGRHLFHFAGHGSYNAFGSTFSTSNLTSLTNRTMPVIVNSMACDCGNFDQYDGLGEQFVNCTNGGAVSTCLNARYGWGAPPNMGPSENLCMEFYNNYVKGFNQGRAYALAKDFYRNAAFSQMTYRWSVYEWTLQGDPTMLMWRSVPVPLLVSCPDTISAQPQVLTVNVSYANYTPAPSARVALLHNNQLVGRGVTDANGVARVIMPAIPDTWTLLLSVTAQDGQPYTKWVYTRSGVATPLVVYRYQRVADENGRLDPGEIADINIVVENRGNLVSTGATGVLRTSSPFITILDSLSHYDTIEVGDTAAGDVYSVRVSRDCPQGERVEMELLVRDGSNSWLSQFQVVVGMPYARRGVWAVHDTADFVIGVCANGGIGTTTWRGEGLGFIYPKSRAWSSSAMMHGSFLLGISYPDTFWVADNYYGTPWQVTANDFAIVESIQPVIPPEFGDQEYIAQFSDSRHPLPKGITVTQRSFVSARPQHKDFLILEYRIHNNDTVTIDNLWAGVACDFRTGAWNQNDSVDYPGVDTIRSLAYVRAQPETVALGVRPIYPAGVMTYANCIAHSAYIENGFTKREKMDFLDGTLRSISGTTMGNWHALVTTGPFTILPADSQIVAFVICGGRTVAQLSASSDTAFNWYEPQVGVKEVAGRAGSSVRIQVQPKLFRHQLSIHWSLSRRQPLKVSIYNTAGELLEEVELKEPPRSGVLKWAPRFDEQGVFFVKVNDQAEKVIRIR